VTSSSTKLPPVSIATALRSGSRHRLPLVSSFPTFLKGSGEHMFESTPIVIGALAGVLLLCGGILSLVATGYRNNFALAFSRLVQSVAVFMMSGIMFYCSALIWNRPGETEHWKVLSAGIMFLGLGGLMLFSAQQLTR